MGIGKIIAAIGGFLGIFTIVLYYVLPEIFCLWRIEGGAMLTFYFGGFGSETGIAMGGDFGPRYTEEAFLLFICILIIAGGAIAIIGGVIEKKILGMLGGILILIGPLLLLMDLAFGLSYITEFSGLIGSDNLFWGNEPGLDWGIWIGFFLAIGGGVLALIGGATLD
jgi:hypothetical protein